MNVKELINRLEELDANHPVQFYFLDNYNLEGCELETIIEADGQVEITIQSTIQSDTDELLEDEQMAQESMSIDIKYRTDEMGNQPIDRDKMIEEMDRKIAELVEGEVIEVPVCDICGKSGNVIEKKDSNSGNYYNICDSTECNTKEKNDGKVSCDKCGKFTDERQMNYYNAYAVCWRCDSDDDSCDECGGDGFIEYDNSSKKEGEVIESYDKEECNKCNGKGKIK